MPKGMVDSQAFREVLFLMRNSLRDLGFPCEIVPNNVDPEKINIILGYNLLEYNDSFRQFHYIPWQLEHLPGTRWFNENAIAILKGALAIWDFSQINIDHLANHGIEASLLRLGHHAGLQSFSPAPEPEFDVVFYGSLNERRQQVLSTLANSADVRHINGLFGAERDEIVARARITLNMHYHESGIQESVRISHLLNNEIFVVSEDSRDDPFPGVDLVTCPYDQLVDTCLDYLKDESAREEKRRISAAQFKQLPMTAYLEPLAKAAALKMM